MPSDDQVFVCVLKRATRSHSPRPPMRTETPTRPQLPHCPPPSKPHRTGVLSAPPLLTPSPSVIHKRPSLQPPRRCHNTPSYCPPSDDQGRAVKRATRRIDPARRVPPTTPAHQRQRKASIRRCSARAERSVRRVLKRANRFALTPPAQESPPTTPPHCPPPPARIQSAFGYARAQRLPSRSSASLEARHFGRTHPARRCAKPPTSTSLPTTASARTIAIARRCLLPVPSDDQRAACRVSLRLWIKIASPFCARAHRVAFHLKRALQPPRFKVPSGFKAVLPDSVAQSAGCALTKLTLTINKTQYCVKLFHNIERFEVKRNTDTERTEELLAQELMVASKS
jgi:hypothetical protein